MVQINWTRTAQIDLKAIFDYIAKDSPKFAKLEVIKIQTRTKLLKLRPLTGKQVPEKDDLTIRELIEGNYRIIYKIIGQKRIDILTIHHSARDLSKRQIE
jgi:addiction module RelE/StbE family toxin